MDAVLFLGETLDEAAGDGWDPVVVRFVIKGGWAAGWCRFMVDKEDR